MSKKRKGGKASVRTPAEYEKALIQVISALPGDSPRQQLLLFARVTLSVMIKSTQNYGLTGVKSFVDADALGLGVFEDPENIVSSRAGPIYWCAVLAHAPFTDLLSRVHQKLQATIKRKGQDFSPADFGSKAAGFLLPYLDPDEETTISDLSCGDGTLLLGALQSIRKAHGQDALRNLTAVASDIDPLCVILTAVQLLANQLLHATPIGRVEVSLGDCIKRDEKLVFASQAQVLEWEKDRPAMAVECDVHPETPAKVHGCTGWF